MGEVQELQGAGRVAEGRGGQKRGGSKGEVRRGKERGGARLYREVCGDQHRRQGQLGGREGRRAAAVFMQRMAAPQRPHSQSPLPHSVHPRPWDRRLLPPVAPCSPASTASIPPLPSALSVSPDQPLVVSGAVNAGEGAQRRATAKDPHCLRLLAGPGTSPGTSDPPANAAGRFGTRSPRPAPSHSSGRAPATAPSSPSQRAWRMTVEMEHSGENVSSSGGRIGGSSAAAAAAAPPHLRQPATACRPAAAACICASRQRAHRPGPAAPWLRRRALDTGSRRRRPRCVGGSAGGLAGTALSHACQPACTLGSPALAPRNLLLQKGAGGFTDVRSPPLEGLDSHSERFQVGGPRNRLVVPPMALLHRDAAPGPCHAPCLTCRLRHPAARSWMHSTRRGAAAAPRWAASSALGAAPSPRRPRRPPRPRTCSWTSCCCSARTACPSAC